ncbi:MAG: MFS transporter [Acidimicrobiia bacterium]
MTGTRADADRAAQPGPFAPLREPNYRLFFAGNLSSNLGTFCQTIAQSLLVYDLTGSTALVGVVNFAQYAAVPVLAPLAGSLADRFDRRRVLLLTQLAAFTVSAVLTVLTVAELVNAWVVIALAGLIGVTGAFQFPVSRALAPLLISERNLGRAINLDSVSVNLARALGPVAGALLVDQFGVSWAFGVNTASYLVLAVVLTRVRPKQQIRHGAGPASLVAPFVDGVRIVRRRPLLAALLFIIAACAIGADPPSTLGPELAHRFGGGDALAGVILGGFGAGGVVGAFVAGAESDRHHRKVGRLLALLVTGLVVFAFADGVVLTVVGAFIAGFGYLTSQTRTSTLLTRATADHERGRVMALWSIAFIGTRPIASLLDGLVADWVSLRAAALLMAVPAVAACALSFGLDRRGHTGVTALLGAGGSRSGPAGDGRRVLGERRRAPGDGRRPAGA